MWEALLKQVLLKIEGKIAPKTEEDLPMWLYKYLLHRFHVLDRTGLTGIGNTHIYTFRFQ